MSTKATMDEKTGAPYITGREKEIVRLLAEGFSTKEMAQLLNISSHTVETYRKNLLLKLQARNTVHLIAKASRMYLI